MTPEQRLDRIERIAKLFVREGLRARQRSREQDERINILINHQIRNDEKFAAHEEKFGNHDEKINILFNQQIRNDEKFAGQDEKFANLLEIHRQTEESFVRLAEAHASLAESQANTDRRLNSLIDIVREGRNGGSQIE